MASTTRSRALQLPLHPITMPSGSIKYAVTDFAVFIDMHRDKPHIPSFEEDIHRGWCKPTPVHYLPPDSSDSLGCIVRVESTMNQNNLMSRPIIAVDETHRFVSVEWWEQFLLQSMLEHGKPPFSMTGEYLGMMPTSMLRDPRRRIYALKSLRQMIVEAERKSGVRYSGSRKPKTNNP